MQWKNLASPPCFIVRIAADVATASWETVMTPKQAVIGMLFIVTA